MPLEFDDELRLAATILRELQRIESGVRPAPQDQTLARGGPLNANYRAELEAAQRSFERDLADLGAEKVELHGDCGDPAHAEQAIPLQPGGTPYWAVKGVRSDKVAVRHGKPALRLRAARIDVASATGRQLVAPAGQPCACGNARAPAHAVCTAYAATKVHGSLLPEISEIVLDLSMPIRAADDGRNRAEISADLLRLIDRLKAMIVPVTAEAELARRLG